ncbi:MAG: DUF1566 domain-containing protein [Methylovulum sp.]|nr:MAG: DUF1566 domain-containing protein [Methylovulum sp.]
MVCAEDALGTAKRLYLIVGGFAGAWYWSSSENDNNNAWNQNFGSGDQNNNNKNNTNAVRAVRDFKQSDLSLTLQSVGLFFSLFSTEGRGL